MASTTARIPSFATTTRLFARALDMSPEQLMRAFRQATADDLPAILSFRNQHGWDDATYLAWRYGLGRGNGAGRGELWLLQHGSVLRGLIGRERQSILCNGQRLDGQLLMDLQLDPALEGAGGGTWLNQAMFGKADVTLAVGANPHSLGLVQRLFAPLPPRRHHVLPLDLAPALESRGMPRTAARLLGPPMVGAWRLRSRWLADRGARSVEVHELAAMSEEILQEIHAGLPRNQHAVAPRARDLNWRLLDNPRARYRLLVALRGGSYVGYAAARVTGGPAMGSALHVIDWLCVDEGHAAVAGALLSRCTQMAVGAGCGKVYTTVLDRRREALMSRLGFLRGRLSPYHLNGVHAPDAAHTALLSRQDWRITDLSFDNDGYY
jgi:hypothetical protein